MRARWVWVCLIFADAGCARDLGLDGERFACFDDNDCARGTICDLKLKECLDPDDRSSPNDHSPDDRFTAVSAGDAHYCAIKTDSTLYCAGSNADSDGAIVSQAVPPIGTFDQVALGAFHSCARTLDGRAVCWGSDRRIGDDGVASSFQSQVPADLGTIELIVAGRFHNCVLQAGRPRCWGLHASSTGTPPDIVLRKISCGTWHCCGIDEQDKINCWGGAEEAYIGAPTGTAKAIGAGYAHNCAVMSEGNLRCWGTDSSGRLDAPPGRIYADVRCGHYYCCALRSDGPVKCWGSPEKDGRPWLSPAGKFSSIAAGLTFVAGVLEDGTLYLWGNAP